MFNVDMFQPSEKKDLNKYQQLWRDLIINKLKKTTKNKIDKNLCVNVSFPVYVDLVKISNVNKFLINQSQNYVHALRNLG